MVSKNLGHRRVIGKRRFGAGDMVRISPGSTWLSIVRKDVGKSPGRVMSTWKGYGGDYNYTVRFKYRTKEGKRVQETHFGRASDFRKVN